MKNNLEEKYPFRANIRQYRKEMGLSQERLAKYFSSGKSFISNFENGHSTPDIYTFAKLADIFNVSLDELIGRDFKY